MKSPPPELSNDGFHDGESELCQKLLTIDGFTGTLLLEISQKLKMLECGKNIFLDLHLKGN